MVKNQREKKMRAAIDGSASLIRIDAPAFVCVLFMCVCSLAHAHTHAHTHVHTAVQLCLISVLGGNHQVTLHKAPFFFPLCVLAQEHIVL